MKINFNEIKTTPSDLPFNLCVFGEPKGNIKEWIDYWNLETAESGRFTNILVGDNKFEDLFNCHTPYEYLDGFSPNLNKELHIGHLSNFCIGNALYHLGTTKYPIAILGDTLDGAVDKEDALQFYLEFCEQFGYNVKDIYYASKQTLIDTSILTDGTDDYAGTKVFTLSNGDKLVGIKNDGSTTYFYQDIALAEKLNGSTIYVTGNEQSPHFESVADISNNVIKHIGLGLVLNNGKKMSSREGNVIFLKEIFDILSESFDDEYLIYNILAGQFLKYNSDSNKNIKLDELSNPKTSVGLYLSYTLARLNSAGLTLEEEELESKLKFTYLKAQKDLNPSTLLKELENHAKYINKLYLTEKIQGNSENIIIFNKLGNQLLSGMKKIGMFNIKKV